MLSIAAFSNELLYGGQAYHLYSYLYEYHQLTSSLGRVNVHMVTQAILFFFVFVADDSGILRYVYLNHPTIDVLIDTKKSILTNCGHLKYAFWIRLHMLAFESTNYLICYISHIYHCTTL